MYNRSEEAFRGYLDEHSLEYERNHIVGDEANPTNVDFFIKSGDSSIYADVKAVITRRRRDEVDAYRNIRKDIRSLRKKFRQSPAFPVILVTMNCSSKFFTGMTVARALLGEVGFYFDSEGRSSIQHLPRGDAVLTEKNNRAISAVLVFDGVNRNHCLFESPFADHCVPGSFFPYVRVIPLDRSAGEGDLVDLSRIMFWEA